MQAGLSTIVEGVLGKPLDKMMQMSDWERRPLSDRQIACQQFPSHRMISITLIGISVPPTLLIMATVFSMLLSYWVL